MTRCFHFFAGKNGTFTEKIGQIWGKMVWMPHIWGNQLKIGHSENPSFTISEKDFM